jgi:hypothetical protein
MRLVGHSCCGETLIADGKAICLEFSMMSWSIRLPITVFLHKPLVAIAYKNLI